MDDALLSGLLHHSPETVSRERGETPEKFRSSAAPPTKTKPGVLLGLLSQLYCVCSSWCTALKVQQQQQHQTTPKRWKDVKRGAPSSTFSSSSSSLEAMVRSILVNNKGRRFLHFLQADQNLMGISSNPSYGYCSSFMDEDCQKISIDVLTSIIAHVYVFK